MSDKIRSYVLGGIVALTTFVGGERALHSYVWAGQVNNEAKAGAATFKYLTEPIGKDKEGKPITRAMVLDAFIKQAQNGR
jgi:hypothetical protein